MFWKKKERRDLNLLFERQNLILDHLKLEHVPEKDVKEPAKLVEKKQSILSIYDALWIGDGTECNTGWGIAAEEPKPKRKYKKRKKIGRPKGSKNKKK